VISGQVIDGLLFALRAGERGLNQAPELIKSIIQEGMWRDFVVDRTGERIRHERFIDFVHTKPLEGLGADVNTLHRLCAEHPEVRDLIDMEVKGKHGGDHGNQYTGGKIDNVQLATVPTGNSSTAALRRLRKDRPDLLKQVIAGNLTPHAGMIQAGFRTKTLSLPIDVNKVASAAATIIKASNTEYAERLAAELEATISFETNASLGATAAFNRTLRVAINAIKQAQEIQDASVDNVEFDAKLIAELEASVALVKQGSGKLPQITDLCDH